ncbi:MAG: DUF3392 family protein [Chitinispirillales bacterium]|jgi:putative Mn2+ efflux pump MntP|nr:DUF3392 family protein [Chitinispirillales bacterium]
MDIVNTVTQYLQSNIGGISFSVTAVTIMIAGPHITSFFKRFTKSYNWFFRYCCYVILCTVGISFLAKFIYQGLKHWFEQQSGLALILWVTGVYLGLALLAKQQKEI